MKLWRKLSREEIKNRIFKALDENVNYYEENILGIPASHLDDKVFYQSAPFLGDAPFMSTLIHNPNHIGCHTLGEAEHFFKGTQKIEKEVIRVCAEDILKGEPNQQDGYVASGGTEANIQAIWIYRNYFKKEFGAKTNEICILCSEDSHYSMDKASDILGVDIYHVPVNPDDRKINEKGLTGTISQSKKDGKKYYIVIANMMTTMFGSVDNIELYTHQMDQHQCICKIHVDGAYGGFFYPFAAKEHKLDLSNPKVTSVTLDAHKMAQAPYGTGLFIIRKGFMHYAKTKEASYVEGEDFTLIGSRSGANAVAVWMILMTNGPYGWKEKILILLNRAEWVCNQLREQNIQFYRNPHSNIITIKSSFINPELANKYGLVPDNHHTPYWYKIVIMDHVTIEKLMPLVEELKVLNFFDVK